MGVVVGEDGVRRSLPAVPLEPLLPRDPERLGEFRLLGRLGVGGMGTAFLAQGPSGWVVVKEAHGWVGADPGARARLVREVAAMRQAAGPRTAMVVDADLDGDVPWVAMEFVPGETLARTVQEGGPLDAQRLATLGRDLAEALVQLHRAGVVHRDLKPSNVMLSPTGARLLDLGIAEVDEGTQLTRTGSVMGSTGWLAPEQVRGDATSPSTDVHAWGLCVLFATTGQAPFGSDSSAAALYRVLESTPQVPDWLPEPLRGLVQRALSKDAAHRPSIEQVLASLTGAPGSSAPTTSATAPATSAAAVSTPQIRTPAPPLPTAASSRASTRSGKRVWIIAISATVTATALAVVVAGIAFWWIQGGTCDGVSTPCEVGDVGPGGGIVFYDAGSTQPWGRYLEAAPSGWSGSPEDPAVQWCADDQPGYDTSLDTRREIGAGAANTALIVQACGSDSAAGTASAYAGGDQEDWFLPSKGDLDALYRQRELVGGLADDAIWSSSQGEGTAIGAVNLFFSDGSQGTYGKNSEFQVRPVRAFGGSPSTNTTAESFPNATLTAEPTAADANVCDGVTTPCEIGDFGPGGGIVFYDAGSPQSWGRYLEAAPYGWSGFPTDPVASSCAEDQSGYGKVLKTGTGMGAGARNTSVIVKACGSDSAAGVASSYAAGGQDDWVLPSKDELNALYEQREVVGGLAGDSYWSSSQDESNPVNAWCQDFYRGWQESCYKYADIRVHPVRSF